ncbi:uncharacterized protein LOC129586055 isoform X2 [Paramacrobiotus metropolitanus]|nr:uncharacterized protein LOC129586055 isoform X2 [Paramacrobiotus metropolitanus]
MEENYTLGKSCTYTYNVAAYVARGTFGIVYQARIIDPGDFVGSQAVAVKVIHMEQTSGTAFGNTILRRINRLLTLKHPRLVEYHKVSVIKLASNTTLEFLMDYHAGGDLAKFLKEHAKAKNHLHSATALTFTIDITEGLKFLHDCGFIHSDLKPENIVISNNRRLLISDCDDLVELQEDATVSGDISELRGTARYMSPEMLKKFSQLEGALVGRKTDMWSLGCIILELTECSYCIDSERLLEKGGLKIPLQRNTNTEYASLIMDGYVPFVADFIEPDVAAWIRQCLCTDPQQRISASELLLLLNYCKGTSVSVTETTPQPVIGTSHVGEQSAVIKEENFGSCCEYDYKIQNRIGGGAMGQVYKATITSREDFMGEDTVAIKVTHLDDTKGYLFTKENWPKLRSRLISVVNFRHGSLLPHHKFCVKKADLGTTYYELMMDFCQGTLDTLLTQSRACLKPTTAIQYATEIAQGISFLHQNRIIHGDIKPKNILVKQLGVTQKRMLIGDLDEHIQMCETITSPKDVTNIHGTIRYIPPEMFKRFKDSAKPSHGEMIRTGRKMDIWSLGCVILDLAECVVNIEEKWLEKTEKNRSERILAGKSITDDEFGNKLKSGYVPLVLDAIPSYLSSCIKPCLRQVSEDRPTADELLTGLAEAYKQAPKEIVVLFHGCKDREMSPVSLQVFEPLTGLIRPLLFRDNFHKKLFKHCLTPLQDVVICQVYNQSDADGHSLQTVAINVREPKWNYIGEPELGQFAKHAVTVDDEVYFWDDREPEKAFRLFKGSKKSVSLLPMTKWVRQLDCLISYKKHLFCVGTPFNGNSRVVERFDTNSEKWAFVAELPEDRRNFAAVVFKGELYLLGGRSGSGADAQMLKSCVRFDRTLREWKKVCDLLQARSGHCAFVSEDQIYVFGGRVEGRDDLALTMETYQPKDESWMSFPLADMEDIDMDPNMDVSYAVKLTLGSNQQRPD